MQGLFDAGKEPSDIASLMSILLKTVYNYINKDFSSERAEKSGRPKKISEESEKKFSKNAIMTENQQLLS